MAKKITKKNLTLRIQPETSRISAIKQIDDALKSYVDVIRIDLLDASFPISRDFLLVLSRRFSSDRYILRVTDKRTKLSAQSIGIQAEVAGLRAEFERQHSSGNLATHNMSMLEYLWYEIRRGMMYVWFLLFGRKKKQKSLPHFKKQNGQVFLIISGLFVSVTLLLFIFYFAVSKTTVIVSPQVTVVSVPANVDYKIMTGSTDLEANNVVEMKRISFPVETSMKFSVTTIDPASSEHASGKIVIYNELTVEQKLRPSTRFITDDGIVFRSIDWVTIPQSKTVNGLTEMGSAEVTVIADDYDTANKVVGDRGNIMVGENLTIPGLKFNRDKVYAKAKQDFVGGKNPSKHVLTEEEIGKFRSTLFEQIKRIGTDIVQEKIDNNDPEIGNNFMLFTDGISFSEIEYNTTSGQKVGDITDEVEIQGKTIVTAVVINKAETIEYLTQVFRGKILDGTEKEFDIHEGTLSIADVISRSEDGTQITATMKMDASKVFDFENSSNDLVKHFKRIILGMPKEKAKDTLINEGYVNDIEIKSSPFWLKNVSSNLDNIDFKIR